MEEDFYAKVASVKQDSVFTWELCDVSQTMRLSRGSGKVQEGVVTQLGSLSLALCSFARLFQVRTGVKSHSLLLWIFFSFLSL